MTTPKPDENKLGADFVLEELHRHRQFHIGQLNVVNMSATIGMGGLALTVIVSAPASGGAVSSWSWLLLGAFIMLVVGGVFLFFAAGLHWLFHAEAVRNHDKAMSTILQDPAKAGMVCRELGVPRGPDHGLSPDGRFTMYSLAACGIGFVVLAAFAFIAARLFFTA